MAYYVGVVHRAQVKVAEREGFVSFSHGRRSAVASVSPGDKVIYYAPRTGPGGEAVQAFVAHATVTGDAVEERAFADRGVGYIRRARYDRVREVPVRPMIDDLSFLSGKANWGGVFRGGKVEIVTEDYQRIAGAMLGG